MPTTLDATARQKSSIPDEVIQWMNVCASSSIRVLVLEEKLLRILIQTTTAQKTNNSFSSPFADKSELSIFRFGILENYTLEDIGNLVRYSITLCLTHYTTVHCTTMLFAAHRNEL